MGTTSFDIQAVIYKKDAPSSPICETLLTCVCFDFDEQCKQPVYDLIKKTEETETLLVFDEAYQQFSGQESTIRYVKNFPHVIVLQTFSKAVGLASARLGYIITQKNNIIGNLNLIFGIKKIYQPY